MKRFCGPQGYFLWSILLLVMGGVACSRSVRVPTEQGNTQTDQAPFHDDSTKSDNGDRGDASSAATGYVPESGLPFHDSQNLPAGTLLMVRLKSAISAGKATAHDVFEASLDDPVVIEGNMLIPRGAMVTGRVESARLSKVDPSRGYIRLTLQSIHVEGVDLPLQTASLFVRQARNARSAPKIRLEKGHRLTFRLTEPVYTPSQTAHLNH